MTSDFPSPDATDFSRLSKEELAGTLRQLQVPAKGVNAEQVNEMQEIIHELQAHRCELEMQNRALRETQGELAESLRRYSDLYDHLPIAYVTLSPEGRIMQANLAACDWLQRERSLLVGTFLSRFLDPYDAGRLAGHLEECVARGGPAKTELTLRMPEGVAIAVQLSSRLASAGPGERLIHAAITDISALKKQQRVLEEINREQETFNASISHDLRAPLITILNYARIIGEEHAGQLDEEGLRMIERIGRAADRMERTLRLLLEYGNLARTEVVLEPVNLGQAIRGLLATYADTIQQAHAEVTNECPDVRLWASPALLAVVTENLLSNALKFVAPGQTPKLRVSAAIEGEAIVVTFADEGIGIEARYHHQIFQVFERLHGYSRYPGTGIGLAIARRGVERMNGRIWVESDPGKGSRFCFGLRKV